MALPKLLQKLFANSGAGPLLRSDIIPTDSALSTTSTNPVQNKVINTALSAKADTTALSGYLPLSGGTMTGDINFQKSGIVRYLHNQITFWGYGLTMDTGDDSENIGARLILRSPSRNGEFGLTAKNGDSQYTVYGNATGTLSWAGQQIARFQSASLTGSPWYVKFHNGLIIQGQNYHITSWGASTVTLPIAFQSTNYVTSVTSWLYRGTSFTKAPEVCVLSRTTTSFDVYCVVGSALPTNWGEYISYVCIGY